MRNYFSLKLSSALVSITALSVAGCSFVAPYKPPIVIPSHDAWSIHPWEEAKPADDIPRGDWWKLFGDTTLNELQKKVERNSPSLGAALARYDQATAFVTQLRAAQVPSVDSVISSTKDKQSADRPSRANVGLVQRGLYNANTVGLLAHYELDLWGRVRNTVAAGEASAQASAADLENTRLSLHALLAEDYIKLRNVDAQTRLLSDTIQGYEKTFTLTKNRHEGGIASGLDVARSEVQLNTVRAELSELRIQRAVYEHAIASLVGHSAMNFHISSSQKSIQLPQIPIGIPSTLLQRRPDIAAAERRATAANAQIGVAKAAFYPSFSLGALLGYQNSGGPNWLTAPNSFWTIGPSMAFNIFDGNLRRAQLEQAKAVLDQAGQEYRGVVLEAFQQVEDELARLTFQKEQSISQEAATEAAQKAVLLASHRYKEGAVNYLEVVIAQTTVLQAQRSLLTLKTQMLLASVSLVRGLGGGWNIR